MADDHRDIQYPPGRNSGKTAYEQADTLGKIAQKMEHTKQKNRKRKLILFEKAFKIAKKCKENKFSTFLYIFKSLIIKLSVENVEM